MKTAREVILSILEDNLENDVALDVMERVADSIVRELDITNMKIAKLDELEGGRYTPSFD